MPNLIRCLAGILFSIASIMLTGTGVTFAQIDPGARDTVRVENGLLFGGQSVVAVTLVNDHPLSGLQIPLHYTSTQLTLDSVVFGTRASTLSGDDIVRYSIDPAGVQQTTMIAVIPLETGSIAVGNDPIAYLHFSQHGAATSDTAIINETSVQPSGGLLFADTSFPSSGYRPVFQSGSLVILPCILTGDVNVTGSISSGDIIYLVGYVFKSGPAPLPCEAAGDVNCTGTVSSSDIIYTVNHVFRSGPPPCDVCTLIPDTWSCP